MRNILLALFFVGQICRISYLTQEKSMRKSSSGGVKSGPRKTVVFARGLILPGSIT
jgi:hypothetical protein